MSLRDQTTLRIVLYEGDGANPLEPTERFSTMTALLEKGFAVTRAAGPGTCSTCRQKLIARAWPFPGGRTPKGEDATGEVKVHFQDITGFDAERVLQSVEAVRTETQSAKHGDWKPWFPVIDYDRCTNCMQCLSFCLFGVYGVDERQQASRCRITTTAKPIARPARAFAPKPPSCFRNTRPARSMATWSAMPICSREKMKVDISALLGGDVYSMLRERSERGQVALLQGTRPRQGAEGTPEMPREAGASRRHPGRGTDESAIAGGNCAASGRSESQSAGCSGKAAITAPWFSISGCGPI